MLVTRRSIGVPCLGLLLLLSVAASAAASDPPVAFNADWELTVPNHGGGAVAIDERWAVIGGPQHGPGVHDDPADFDLRNYVLVISEPEGDLVETLVGSDTGPGDRFGYDVAISGDLIAVGAPAADNERGAVYVFALAGGPVTEERIRLTDGYNFGSAVDIDGTRLVAVGSDGRAAVFDLEGETWQQTHLPAISIADGFGGPLSIALDGNTFAVGRSGVGDEGVVDVYTKTADGWTVERLVASNLGEVFGYPGFGASVDVAGDCLIAGAPNTFVGAGYLGGAYVFCRSGSGWSESKLTVPEQTNDDGFGSAVALLGRYYALVGAPKHDTGAYNAGSVYVFTRVEGSWQHAGTLEVPAGHVRDEGGFGSALDLIRGRLMVGASGPSAPSANGEVFAFTGPFEGWFWDDDGSIFTSDIDWLATAGITKGCDPPSNLKFCPGVSVSRGQMAAFLVRALGLTDDGGGNTFIDDDGSVFEADIPKLAAAGITRGCNPPRNDKFCPNDPVTRAQMAAFLVRALGLTDDAGGNTFIDDDGSLFEADIAKLAAAGITAGCNPPANDMFCPDRAVTRAQMAAFMHRALPPAPFQEWGRGF